MDAYKKGFIDGLMAYAHWKDGVQWVGTMGTKLEAAIEKVEGLWNYNPPTQAEVDEQNENLR